MRIGIDIRSIGGRRTGDELYTVELVRHILKTDKKNYYYLYTDVADDERLRKIKREIGEESFDDKVRIISVVPAYKLFWTFFLLLRQARKDKLDLLHVQYITPLFFLGKLKVVTTIHDISFARFPRFIKWLDLLFLRILIPWSLRKADGIIAISQFTKNELISVYNVPAEKIKLIYNGGGGDSFRNYIPNDNGLNSLKKYGIMKPYLLYVGTLQPRKNIVFLIDFFSELKVKYKGDALIDNLELVIRGTVGGYNYDQRIDNRLSELKDNQPDVFKKIKLIDYLDRRNELLILFSEAEVFCFPSLYEGFGLPVIEAMMVGTPVLVANSSCLPEIVRDGGLLANPADIDDWVDKVNELLHNQKLKQKYIENGYRVAGLFDWSKTARETVDFYEELIFKK